MELERKEEMENREKGFKNRGESMCCMRRKEVKRKRRREDTEMGKGGRWGLKTEEREFNKWRREQMKMRLQEAV